jgi:signal transduction histidine kinase
MVSAIAGKEETPGTASSREIVSGAARQVMETAQPLVINDTTEVPENTYATESEMAVPIRLSKDIMGVLDIKSAEKGAFNELDIFTASTLADFVAIGIENAHLYRNVRDIATLEERNRLAREIHDTLAQGFVGVIRQLEVAKRMVDKDTAGANKHLDQAETLARSSLNEARRSVMSLRQSLVKHVPLPDAIRDEASRFSEINDIPVNVNISGQPLELKPDDEESFLRVFQEAMTNVGRHSGASMVDVDLSYNDKSINLSIHDNGTGFDTRKKKQGSFGIIDMKERVSLLKGKFKIESKPGRGTTIIVSIPT